MADRTARPLQRARGEAERKPHLRLIAGALDAAPGGPPAPLAAPAVPPPLLSPSSDICGIGRAGWAAAALLYAAVGAATMLAPWRVTPPEPWPPNATVVTLVFEEPPAPPAPAPP